MQFYTLLRSYFTCLYSYNMCKNKSKNSFIRLNLEPQNNILDFYLLENQKLKFGKLQKHFCCTEGSPCFIFYFIKNILVFLYCT